MKHKPLGIVPLGDCAAYVEFSRTLDLETNAFIQRLGVAVEDAARAQDIRALRDVVPTFGGIALHFDPDFDGDVLQAAGDLVHGCLRGDLPRGDKVGRLVELPVCYEGPFALDMGEVAEKTKLTPEKVAELHAGREIRVLMMGFAPGHPYMGLTDPKLAVPRRTNPRVSVPGGSIGIANEQTVVYPYTMPGGWNIIGRTPLPMFDAARPEPSLLRSGDRVRFRRIDAEEFARLAQPQ